MWGGRAFRADLSRGPGWVYDERHRSLYFNLLDAARQPPRIFESWQVAAERMLSNSLISQRSFENSFNFVLVRRRKMVASKPHEEGQIANRRCTICLRKTCEIVPLLFCL